MDYDHTATMIWIKIGKRCALSFSKYSNNNSVGGCMCSWEEKHLQDGWKLDRHEKRMLRRERETEPYQPNQTKPNSNNSNMRMKKNCTNMKTNRMYFSHTHTHTLSESLMFSMALYLYLYLYSISSSCTHGHHYLPFSHIKYIV